MISGSSRPRDVAVDANGDVYTLDTTRGRLGSVYVYRRAAIALTSARLRYRSGRIAVKTSAARRGPAPASCAWPKTKVTIATRSYSVGE